MTYDLNPKARPVVCAASAAVAAALSLVAPVWAQDATQPTQLKPTVVTGTYLESADAAGTLTVTPVELTQPINQGFSTVADVLRTKLPQYGGPGNLNPAFGNGGDGNSYVSLRGLPGNATLVLVNGRRTSLSALNLIPDAAVEKIEILNDGGSAVYGSDAIAGVINIILRKDFQGTRITGYYGGSTQSPSPQEKKFQLLSGDSTEKGSFVISAEYTSAEGLYSPDRSPSDASRGTSGTSNPGTFANNTDYGTFTTPDGQVVPNALGLTWHVNPAAFPGGGGLTSPTQVPAGFNPYASVDTSMATSAAQARSIRDQEVAARNAALGPNSPVLYGSSPRFFYPAYTTLYRPYEKYDFSATGEYKLIGDHVRLFADAYYTKYMSEVQLAPSPLSNLGIPTGNYWLNTVFPGATPPPGARLNQSYRVVELGPRLYNEDTEDFRFVGGLRGDILDTTWKWEAGYLYTKGIFHQRANGGLVMDQMNALLAGTDPTAWNPFNYTPPFSSVGLNDPSSLSESALLQQFYVTQGADFTVGGEVIDIPGGALGLAAGMNYRRETFENRPDLATKQGLVFPFNTSEPWDALRDIWGGYAEVVVPIFGNDFTLPGISEFSVSAAVRYEDYSDVGDTDLKPRISARWKPLEKEAITLRGSYAEGFSAPTFGQLYALPGQDFTEIYNPYTGQYEQPIEAVLTEGNPNLKPTEGKTWLGGAEYSPRFIKGFTIGGNYYRIEQTGIPFSSEGYIVDQWYNAGGNSNPNNPWGPNAVPSGPNPTGTQVEYNDVTGQFVQIRHLAPINTGERTTDGIDIQLSQVFESDFGTFTLAGLATRVLTWEQQDVPTGPTVDYLGRYWDSAAALPDTGYPKWRSNVSLSWEWKRYMAAFAWNFTEGYIENFDGTDREVDPYNTLDLRVGYKIPWAEAELMVGVNNLLDEDAPTVYSSFENNFDRAIGDPRGRMVFVSLSKTF